MVIDDIEKRLKGMVYLDHDNEFTLKYDERRSSEVHVFQNWNDFASGIINVLFDEENEFIRSGRKRNKVVRNLECGCIPAKFSRLYSY